MGIRYEILSAFLHFVSNFPIREHPESDPPNIDTSIFIAEAQTFTAVWARYIPAK
jgi:hypothetical protein